MSELKQQLFLTSRDQYEAAVRWAFVLVVIGVTVHATIFSRAVEIQKELHTKQTALKTLSLMHEAEGLAALRSNVDSVLVALQSLQVWC